MSQRERLVALVVLLLAAVGLLVWQVAAPPGRPPPPSQPSQPHAVAPPPADGAARPAPARSRGRCADADLAARVQRYVPHRLEGNTGEAYVDRCDGSPPLALAATGSGGWGNLYSLDEATPELRTLWFERDAEAPEDELAIGVQFAVAQPERLYEAPLQVRSPRWRDCLAPLAARYEILGFPRPRGPGDHLHVEFAGLCRETGELVTGFVQVPGRPVDPLTGPADPGPDEEEGEEPDAGADAPAAALGPGDDPLDSLRPCPPHGAARAPPREPPPAPPGEPLREPLRWLGGARPGEEASPLYEGARAPPYAPDLAALARAHVRGFDLSGPLTPAMRRQAADIERRTFQTEGDPDPFHVPFEIPAKELLGHLYVLGPQGPVEVAPSAAGVVRFAVDRNGCEVGPRWFAAALRLTVQEEGALVWSAAPVRWSAPRRLAAGKELSIREVKPAGEGEPASYELTLAAGARRLRGRADAARFRTAYLVQAAGRELLWVDYDAAEYECVGITVYDASGAELRPVGGLARGSCL